MDPLVLHGRVILLLENIAELRRPCKFCGEMIYFIRHRSGNVTPYTGLATNHFTDCPHFLAKEKRATQQPLLNTSKEAF